ncbi:MAG: hypothetical protein ACK4NN_15890, partial [Rheinheimera sp.]
MVINHKYRASSTHRLFSRSLIAGAVFVACTPVSAETAPSDEAKIEKISVTGSHIRKGNFDSPSPITVMDAKDIQGVGSVNIGDFLGKIPAVV